MINIALAKRAAVRFHLNFPSLYKDIVIASLCTAGLACIYDDLEFGRNGDNQILDICRNIRRQDDALS